MSGEACPEWGRAKTRERVLELPGDVDDVPVENAPVRRHTHGGLTVEGYSRAAVQTYWRIPELKIGFDFGLQPWSFMTTKTWALSHTHIDHVAALPVYVSRRRLMKMAPPTIFLPRSAVEGVQALLSVVARLDGGRLPCELIACEPGDEFELSRTQILSAFATQHRLPSLGYVVWDLRRKLRPEYGHLTGEEIRDLRMSGVEITYDLRAPLVAFLGDSNPKGLDDNPVCYEAKILILEMTFLAAVHRREKIHKFGHIHLDDIIERAGRFENELIIASHFSTRYDDHQIRRMVEKRLPVSLRDRLLLWL